MSITKLVDSLGRRCTKEQLERLYTPEEWQGFIWCASLKEAKRLVTLMLEQQAGRITDLRWQVSIPIRINGQLVANYVADFVYERNGKTVVEDAKGYQTEVFKLKRKLLRALGVEVTLS